MIHVFNSRKRAFAGCRPDGLGAGMLSAVSGLLAELAPLLHRAEGGEENGARAIWGDEENVYLEFLLPGSEGMDLDLRLSEGRGVLRLRREAEPG